LLHSNTSIDEYVFSPCEALTTIIKYHKSSDAIINPKGNTTRAAVAAMLNQSVTNVRKKAQ
jgi:hypothetical protein